KTLLIDASQCFEPRRKSIGNKRVDISTPCRNMIVRMYGEYRTQDCEEQLDNGRTIVCRSRLMDNVEFGYNKIVVESPALDEKGAKILKKGKPVADSNKRDTENVPLNEDINAYFAREVLPYNPEAWIDKTKTKVGYEIPFTRTFYVYKELEKADDIAARIEEHEHALMEKLHALFGKEE
ncbi:MAG: SAM-dependent DNA methyltransferase, partial [Kiritimatiellae bacterium]|nr:SAM-dependent DNA methyltransferase [Kiritimatiellia bacterium]